MHSTLRCKWFAVFTLAATLSTPVFAADKIYQVAADASYAPFESLDDNKQVTGFDVDLLKAIAAKAGFAVKFINTPWEGIFTTLTTGDRDIVGSAVTITAERKRTMDFSTPYFEARQLIAVASSSKVTRFADLKNLKVAVQAGTTGDDAVQALQGKTSNNIQRFESTPLAIQALRTGSVDAVVADNGVLVNDIANNKSINLKLVDDAAFAKEFYGFAVKKGNKDLLDKLNQGLAGIKADGTYEKIYSKYFGPR